MCVQFTREQKRAFGMRGKNNKNEQQALGACLTTQHNLYFCGRRINIISADTSYGPAFHYPYKLAVLYGLLHRVLETKSYRWAKGETA